MKGHIDEATRIECPRHGSQKLAILCTHLRLGSGQGFFRADAGSAQEYPWLPMAWCEACDAVLLEEGDWNDRSEDFAKPGFLCQVCFEEVRAKNELADPT